MQSESPLVIVIADANERDRDRIKRLTSMYTSGRYDFREADTGAGVIELVERESADCLLLADPLADMPAWEVVDRVHAERDPLPIVAFAEQIDEVTAERTLANGAAVYLMKRELSAHSISTALQQAFAHAQALRFQREQAKKEAERLAAEHAERAAAERRLRAALTTLDIPLEWSLGGRWRNASVCGLTTLGLRAEDIAALPPEGAVLELSLELLNGVPPLQLRGEVIRMTDTGGFEVAFRGLGRRDKILLRNAASRARRASKNEPS